MDGDLSRSYEREGHARVAGIASGAIRKPASARDEGSVLLWEDNAPLRMEDEKLNRPIQKLTRRNIPPSNDGPGDTGR